VAERALVCFKYVFKYLLSISPPRGNFDSFQTIRVETSNNFSYLLVTRDATMRSIPRSRERRSLAIEFTHRRTRSRRQSRRTDAARYARMFNPRYHRFNAADGRTDASRVGFN